MADQVDAIVLLVGAGELVFAQLAGSIVSKVGEGGETPLAVVPLDHANEKNGGFLLRKKCFFLDETGEIGGGPYIDFGGVKLDRIGKFQVRTIDTEKGMGVILGQLSGFIPGNDVVRDASNLVGLRWVDGEGGDWMNLYHRGFFKVAESGTVCLIPCDQHEDCIDMDKVVN